MALDVTIAATSTESGITTVASLKEIVLGATATSTNADGYFEKLITRSSKWAETYMNRGPLDVRTYRETVAGFGRRSLMLSRTPIRAIKAVYRGTDTDDATQLETSEFVVEDRDAGLIARNIGFSWNTPLQGRGSAISYGDAFPLDPAPLSGQEYKPWLVDYVAGWTFAGIDTGSTHWSTEAGTTSTGRTLPEDIEFGVLLRAQGMYQNRDGISSESLGDLAVSYNARSNSEDSMPSWEQQLSPWRRMV